MYDSIETEIKRIKLIIMIDHKFNIYKNYNESLFTLFLKQKNNGDDPILTLITNSFNINIPEDIIKKVNVQISKAIKILKEQPIPIYPINEVIKIKKKNKIILKYKDVEIPILIVKYKEIISLIVDSSYKKYYSVDTLLWILYNRYISLGIYDNRQGSIHPKHYKMLKSLFNADTEGFGSFFNHILKNYYGTFHDLEKYFGCIGNFYESKLIKSIYVINPPFTELDIKLTINHMLKELEIRKDLTIIYVFPSWISTDRKKLKKICKSKNKIYDDIETDKFLNKFSKSSYIKQDLLYCKDNFMYFNYINNKNVYFSSTNLIVLSNNKKFKYDLQDIFGKADIVNK